MQANSLSAPCGAIRPFTLPEADFVLASLERQLRFETLFLQTTERIPPLAESSRLHWEGPARFIYAMDASNFDRQSVDSHQSQDGKKPLSSSAHKRKSTAGGGGHGHQDIDSGGSAPSRAKRNRYISIAWYVW